LNPQKLLKNFLTNSKFLKGKNILRVTYKLQILKRSLFIYFSLLRAGRAVGDRGTSSENYPCRVYLYRNYTVALISRIFMYIKRHCACGGVRGWGEDVAGIGGWERERGIAGVRK
jgi:hypothetical protein